MSRSLQELAGLYAYNRWANARAFDACSILTPDEVVRPIGGSFSTILGTLAHLVGAEWVWIERWQGRSPRALPAGFASLEELRSTLTEVEAWQKGFLETLAPERLAEPISYVNFKGENWTYALEDMLVHVVNHGSYHRGQVATLLRQLEKVPLSTDYLLFLDEKKKR